MGGKSNDFGDVAAAQGAENEGVVRDQLYANRPDQYSPWGATSWESTPYTDAQGNKTERWAQTTSLSPELMDIYNKQTAITGGRTDLAGMMTGRLGGEFGQAQDWRGLNPMGQVPTSQYTLPEHTNRQLDYGGIPGVDDPYGTRQRAEDAVYSQAQSRLAPRFANQRKEMEIKLRNQGIGPEDASWKSQMGAIDQQETDSYNQAQYSAVGAGRDESGQMFDQMMGRRQQYGQERQNQANYYNQAGQQAYNQALGANAQNFGQSMQGSAYANQIRQQQITEALTKRGASLNEINALLSGGQVSMPNMPSFTGAQAAQPAPIYQAGQDSYNADQAGTQNLMNLAGSGMQAAAMFSDRRLKSNIKPAGTRNGHKWYTYTIFGNPGEGVMADEVPASYTSEVGGYLMVDYNKVLGE